MVTSRNYDEIISNPQESIYALPGNNPLSFIPNPYTYQTGIEVTPKDIEKRWWHAIGGIISGLMLIIGSIFMLAASRTLGIAGIVAGALLVAVEVNNAVDYETGTNWIKVVTGISYRQIGCQV